jgi:hypothetical protein
MDIKNDKNNFDENVNEKVKSDNDNKLSENDKEVSSGVKKTFSRRRAVLRIFLGFIALVLWIFIGLSPTIIFSSSIQEFIGAFSFLVRNPIIFLLVALLNIFLGLLVYFTLGIIWWAAFHFIWSIRWFYGYFKYRTTTLEDVIKSMRK